MGIPSNPSELVFPFLLEGRPSGRVALEPLGRLELVDSELEATQVSFESWAARCLLRELRFVKLLVQFKIGHCKELSCWLRVTET